MIPTLITLAKAYDAYEHIDHSEFQRSARILQSLWRIKQGYPPRCASAARAYGLQ